MSYLYDVALLQIAPEVTGFTGKQDQVASRCVAF